ncbi:MAG: cysteine desulfurase-like protein [Myxococcota bacterium]|nr:cysteine desulfurase-like protein [Myxococcota bacterium]
MIGSLDISAVRAQYPALARAQDGRPVVFFDGPAGSQVPQRVIDASSHALGYVNANTHGEFVTARENDAMLAEAHAAMADLVGSDDPDLVAFGPNMTTLTMGLSRALGRTWGPGDEIVVTRLDHDANVWPWALAARDAGATLRYVDIDPRDCTLDMDSLSDAIGPATKHVAVGAASNAVGTINPLRKIADIAHAVGATVFVDAVHYAPHGLIDVDAWGCDFLACSAYKFFGPHVGVLWGRREWMTTLDAYRVRPAGDDIPDRWMTGTQNHEGIAGALEAVNYLADLGRAASGEVTLGRREALAAAFEAIGDHEAALCQQMIAGLEQISGVRVLGITDPGRSAERCPTISIVHDQRDPMTIARHLGADGIFVWEGHFYALELSQTLGLEPDGMVRIGLLHYNTREEVDRLLRSLNELVNR